MKRRASPFKGVFLATTAIILIERVYSVNTSRFQPFYERVGKANERACERTTVEGVSGVSERSEQVAQLNVVAGSTTIWVRKVLSARKSAYDTDYFRAEFLIHALS